MIGMRYSGILSIFGAAVLTGCQSTTTVPVSKQPLEEMTTPVEAQTSQEAQAYASAEDVLNALTLDTLLVDGKLQQESTEPALEDYNNLWMRIRSQFSFDIPQNRRVVTQRNWYAKNQKYLNRVAKRAEPFLYFIVEEIERRNMPMELALLPIVESAFDPFAYSHGRASGMWQFISGTGTRYGLKQNWWYDGRRDVIASTRAALDYLSFLHKTLDGDWMNAIAAYNSGEGRVLRAIKKNKRKHLPTDFWSLDLPNETDMYVPKLLALVDLLKRHEEFKMTWPQIANHSVVEIVDTKRQTDLSVVADLSGYAIDDLYKLNPGYNQWASDPKGPHTFLLPKKNAALLRSKLSDAKLTARPNWERYTIRSGDSLNKIAVKFKTTVAVLQSVNNIKGNMIREGGTLLIPVAAKDPKRYQLVLASKKKVAKQLKRTSGTSRIDYTVKKGDSFWKIAQKFKISTKQLSKWNQNKLPKQIRPGDKLVIWKTKSKNAKTLRTITYKVRSGDSLARIAKKFKISVNDILAWNQLDEKQFIQPGQKLKLHIDVTRS
ncbi:lytic transglycosylase [Algicola sagamiensis]|uniref:lytic transglycosylase n=1 Tax=Algicola sagamiensis TaxID=163869 RepID=UPI00037482FF|nr:LysM peptidoglycan-binding domain-containing protein [Algicola sagamiensis]